MNMDLTQIILAVITLLGTVVTTLLVPLLKNKLTDLKSRLTENQFNMLKLFVNTAVTAAEQLYNSTEGQEKKKYVINLLYEAGYIDNPEQIDRSVDAAIEAAVLELHRAIEAKEDK